MRWDGSGLEMLGGGCSAVLWVPVAEGLHLRLARDSLRPWGIAFSVADLRNAWSFGGGSWVSRRWALILIAAASFTNASAQTVEPDYSMYPPRDVALTVTDPFGFRLDNVRVMVDGKSAPLDRWAHLPLRIGARKLVVSHKGFGSSEIVVHVTEETSSLTVCLPLGALHDNEAVPQVSVSVKGTPEAISNCGEVMILPLYCASTRPASRYKLFRGKADVGKFLPGAYVAAVIDGERTCSVSRFDVPLGARIHEVTVRLP